MRLRRLGTRAGRWLWQVHGALGASFFLVVLLGGAFRAPGPGRIVLGAVLLVLTGERVWRRARLAGDDLRLELEASLTLLLAAYSAMDPLGGPASPLHPIAYVVAATIAASERRLVLLASAALALLVEWRAAPELLPWHAALLASFGVWSALLFRAELLRLRREHGRRLAEEVRNLREEARDFRLISTALGPDSRLRSRAEEEEKLAQGSVETIRQGLYYLLELCKRSLDLDTCVLLWLDESGDRLKIKECVSDADVAPAAGSIPASAGAVGGIVRTRAPLALVRPGAVAIPYYPTSDHVGSFLGVPVLENGHLRGVLCADRREVDAGDGRGPQPRPFVDQDAALLKGAAVQVLRIVQSERVFGAVERSKYETERFYQASRMLASALTLDQVYEKSLEAARALCEFDFAGITLVDEERKRHRVCRVYNSAGEPADVEEGLEYADNAGLVAMAVKNKHTLLGEGQGRVVFTRQVKLKGMESLLVLPLLVKDEAIGALTLASARRNHFSQELRDRLGVIANQIAICIENAKMYRRMEEMATTDGLTGLVNHRTFQERLDDALRRASRHSTRLCLVLCDIDHFKSINDTYGHPVGDVVLRRVAHVLAESVRKIDVVARYGGEEFALILGESELAGAMQLCERIRQDVKKQQFGTDRGTFHVTISLGVAGFPDDGATNASLIERSDQALYKAKRGGRDRTIAYRGEVRAAS